MFQAVLTLQDSIAFSYRNDPFHSVAMDSQRFTGQVPLQEHETFSLRV